MLGHGHGHETAGVYDRVGQSSMTEPVPWIQALRKPVLFLSYPSDRTGFSLIPSLPHWPPATVRPKHQP